MLSKVKFLSPFTCKTNKKKQLSIEVSGIRLRLLCACEAPRFSRNALWMEDTSLDVRPNDVSVHVKVDPDEFALQKSNQSQLEKKKKKRGHWRGRRVYETFMSVLSYKSRRVVVLNGLCVAEGLQDGVCLQQLLLQLSLTDKTHHQNYR